MWVIFGITSGSRAEPPSVCMPVLSCMSSVWLVIQHSMDILSTRLSKCAEFLPDLRRARRIPPLSTVWKPHVNPLCLRIIGLGGDPRRTSYWYPLNHSCPSLIGAAPCSESWCNIWHVRLVTPWRERWVRSLRPRIGLVDDSPCRKNYGFSAYYRFVCTQ